VQLAEQGFVVIYAHISKLQLENVADVHPANTECPTCQGKARVPIHGGLREQRMPTLRRPQLGQGIRPVERCARTR